ncbi:MAG: D-glycero-beta-D-manno-heptose 1-phosphate adenylyltransferase [Planctomycetota bacterium]
MTDLLNALAEWGPFNALVVGDFMLDELLYGDAERLSPDAPVPVLRARRTEHRPGGAANVCLDLAAMMGRVSAVGLVGNDEAGRTLAGSLQNQGVDATGLVTDADRPTTVKRSLIGLAQHRHPQKMFRVDFESSDAPGERARRALLTAFEERLLDADVVCLEDYNKGVLTGGVGLELIRLARAANKQIIVDPAPIDGYPARYHGATAITPNRSEAERAIPGNGTPHTPDALARRLLETCALDAVVLTLDKDGALLLERGSEPRSMPTIARQVYDVTGAGDMVLAGLAAARARGLGWADAVELANAAAGLEVEVFGVQPMPIERIHHAVLDQRGALRGKLRTLEDVAVEVAARRQTGQRIVFTNGCFDLLHAGHIRVLEEARAQGDMLVVGLNTDESIRRLKGVGRPINTTQDRGIVLGALRCVDAIVPFSDDTPVHLIDVLVPDVLVKGSDYREDEVVGARAVREAGGRVHFVELVPGKSTTSTIERLANP